MFYKLTLVTILAIVSSICALTGHNVTQVLDSILRGCDKRVRPNHGGPRVDVQVTLHVLKLYDFSNLNNDFKIEFYLRQQWNDPRLVFPDYGHGQKIMARQETISRLWIPDTFFPSDKDGYQATITIPNAFVSLSYNGSVFMSQRFTTHTECEGGLAFYPMDRHVCKLDIESYGMSTRDIKYAWGNKPSVDVELASFTVVSTDNYVVVSSLVTGNYSRVGLSFTIDRKTSPFISRYYLPAILIVLTSFLPFYLDAKKAIFVAAGALAVLLIFSGIVSTMLAPNSGVTTALDLFLLASIGTAFVSLLLVVLTVYLAEGDVGENGVGERKVASETLNSGRLAIVLKIGRFFLPLVYAITLFLVLLLPLLWSS